MAAVLLGAFHALFLPSWTNRSVLVWTERLEVDRAHDFPRFQLSPDDVAGGPEETASRAYATDLVRRGLAYRTLVSPGTSSDGRPPSLTKRGLQLRREVDAARPGQAS